MGGKGSGALPGDTSNHGGGRQKRAAVGVVGVGVPIKPEDLPYDVGDCWDRIAETVSGVAFSQDSDAITEAAWLVWQLGEVNNELHDQPLNTELTKSALALKRTLSAFWTQFGMTPRSRQVLLVQKDEEELDEYEQMLKDRE